MMSLSSLICLVAVAVHLGGGSLWVFDFFVDQSRTRTRFASVAAYTFHVANTRNMRSSEPRLGKVGHKKGDNLRHDVSGPVSIFQKGKRRKQAERQQRKTTLKPAPQGRRTEKRLRAQDVEEVLARRLDSAAAEDEEGLDMDKRRSRESFLEQKQGLDDLDEAQATAMPVMATKDTRNTKPQSGSAFIAQEIQRGRTGTTVNERMKATETEGSGKTGTRRTRAASGATPVADFLAQVESNLKGLRDKIVEEVATQCAEDSSEDFEFDGIASSLENLGECGSDQSCFEIKNGVQVSYSHVGVQNAAASGANTKKYCLQRGIADLFLRESRSTASGKLLRSPITNANKDEPSADLGFASVVLEPIAAGSANDQVMVRWPLSSHAPDMTSAPWYVRTLTRGVTKNVLIALDRSGSMDSTDSWGHAETAARRVLESLGVTDRFLVMTYQHPVQFSAFEFVHATQEHVDAAKQWLAGIVPGLGAGTVAASDDVNGEAHSRPDAEYGIGAAIVVGTLGVVPDSWQQKIKNSVAVGQAERQAASLDVPPHRIDLPPFPVPLTDQVGDCRRAVATSCEETLVLLMTDENFSSTQYNHKFGKWLSHLLGATTTVDLDSGADTTPDSPAVRMNIYRFDTSQFGTPSVDGPFQDIVEQFHGEAEVVQRQGDLLGERMATYWRNLISQGEDSGVVWTSHEDEVEGYHLTACAQLNVFNGALRGVVCVDPRAALSLSLQQLHCMDDFADAMSEKLSSTACSIATQATTRQTYCDNLTSYVAPVAQTELRVQDFVAWTYLRSQGETNLVNLLKDAVSVIPCGPGDLGQCSGYQAGAGNIQGYGQRTFVYPSKDLFSTGGENYDHHQNTGPSGVCPPPVCLCNNGDVNETPSSCTKNGHQNCQSCHSGYEPRSGWPSAQETGCHPVCGGMQECPAPDSTGAYHIRDDSKPATAWCDMQDDVALVLGGMSQPDSTAQSACQTTCCIKGCKIPAQHACDPGFHPTDNGTACAENVCACENGSPLKGPPICAVNGVTPGCATCDDPTFELIDNTCVAPGTTATPNTTGGFCIQPGGGSGSVDVAYNLSAVVDWVGFLSSPAMQPPMTADAGEILGNASCAVGFAGEPTFWCANASEEVLMTGCAAAHVVVTEEPTDNVTLTTAPQVEPEPNATDTEGGTLAAPLIGGGAGLLLLLLLLLLFLMSCGAVAADDEEELEEEEEEDARWDYNPEVEAIGLDFGDCETALLETGLSAAYAAKLARLLAGPERKDKKVEAPTEDSDLTAMQHLGFEFDTDDGVEVGFVRGMMRRAVVRHKADPEHYTLGTALLACGYEFGAAETALVYGGLTRAGARKVAKHAAGPTLDTEVLDVRALGDADTEALRRYWGFEGADTEALRRYYGFEAASKSTKGGSDTNVLTAGTLRQALRAKVARDDTHEDERHVSTFAFDVGLVETAFISAGLTPAFAKKMARQVTDRETHDDDELTDPEDEKDAEIMKQLGLEFAGPERVGRMRGFLEKVAAQQNPKNASSSKKLHTEDQIRQRLEDAGFSEKAVRFLAPALVRNAKAGKSDDLQLSAETRQQFEEVAEGHDLDLFGGIERTNAWAPFAYTKGAQRASRSSSQSDLAVAIDLRALIAGQFGSTERTSAGPGGMLFTAMPAPKRFHRKKKPPPRAPGSGDGGTPAPESRIGTLPAKKKRKKSAPPPRLCPCLFPSVAEDAAPESCLSSSPPTSAARSTSVAAAATKTDGASPNSQGGDAGDASAAAGAKNGEEEQHDENEHAVVTVKRNATGLESSGASSAESVSSGDTDDGHIGGPSPKKKKQKQKLKAKPGKSKSKSTKVGSSETSGFLNLGSAGTSDPSKVSAVTDSAQSSGSSLEDSSGSGDNETGKGEKRHGKKHPKKKKPTGAAPVAALPPGLLGEAEAALQAIGFTRRQAHALGQQIADTAEGELKSEAMRLNDEERQIAEKGLGGATILDLQDLVAELVHQKPEFFHEYTDGDDAVNADTQAALDRGEPVSILAHKVKKAKHPKAGAKHKPKAKAAKKHH
ncbi:unnamed protein product [Amoebophrya sp. A120]|nr:unnamed protein product [Amoebophrya sp. A120]|eukprot:GSA120T00003281001.1